MASKPDLLHTLRMNRALFIAEHQRIPHNGSRRELGAADNLYDSGRLGLPTPFSARIARNTQIIVQEESHICNVIDPFGTVVPARQLLNDHIFSHLSVKRAIEEAKAAVIEDTRTPDCAAMQILNTIITSSGCAPEK